MVPTPRLGNTSVFGVPATRTIPVANGLTSCQSNGPVIEYAYVPLGSENTIEAGATALLVCPFSVTSHDNPDGRPTSVNVDGNCGDAPGDPTPTKARDGWTEPPADDQTDKPAPIEERIKAPITIARPRVVKGLGVDPIGKHDPSFPYVHIASGTHVLDAYRSRAQAYRTCALPGVRASPWATEHSRVYAVRNDYSMPIAASLTSVNS